MAGVMSHFKKNKGPNMVGQRSNEELWTRTGTFINKPTRGWLHIEDELKDHGGVCYGVRYVGCVEVKQSMRTLPFEMRGQVTKEAIFRVCDAAGFKYTRKKKASKTICKIIGENPNILFGGANVNLTISTASINIRIKETGKPIANHQMQGISFASGGDAETQNYVAYVAKDPVNGRACHVLECLAGLAQDVITTVGQAFEIRFKDYLRNPPQVFSTPDRMEEPLFQEEESAWGDDPDYYNDISKLSVNLQGPERGVPPPPTGQYMPTSPIRQQPYQELLGQQVSSGSSPVGPPPGYTANPPPYFDNPTNSNQASSNPRGQGTTPGHQPMTGRLIDIDNEPAIYGATAGMPSPSRNNAPTALDNPLQRSSRHTSSSSSQLSPQHSPTHNNNIKKPSRKAKRRTPSLYDNPPTKEEVEASLLPLTKQLTPAERTQYQNIIASPDWKKLVDSGYDNLRMLNIWKQSKSVVLHKGADQAEYANAACLHDDHDEDDVHGNRNEKEEEEDDDALGSMMYDDQRPVSANYDNPQSPKFGDRKMTEAAYNASLPNHPLNLEVGQQQLQRTTSNGDPHSIDPFDMEPFNPEAAKQPSNPSALGVASGVHHPDMFPNAAASASAPPTNPLYNEEWFHGPMSRKEGEALLSNDGDFLVRESTTAKDQYVLSGMQNGVPKHLLLVDPQGKVRTKDKEFDSVSHLINYHRNNRLPIISAGSAVHLKTPVVRKFKT